MGAAEVCGQIAGVNLNDLNDLYKVRNLKKSQSILADPSRPIFNEFMRLPPGCRDGLQEKSFVPVANGFLDNSL